MLTTWKELIEMEVIVDLCAFLDVHRDTVMACAMDRRHELEVMHRSLAMLTPGVQAPTREDALRL